MNKIKEYYKKASIYLKGLTLRQWCGLAGVFVISLSVGWGIGNARVDSKMTMQQEGRVTTIIKEQPIPYIENGMDTLLNKLAKEKSFKELVLHKNGNHKYSPSVSIENIYGGELEVRMNNRGDLLPIIGDMVILSELGSIDDIDVTPYISVSGTPTTLRELLWYTLNTEGVRVFFKIKGKDEQSLLYKNYFTLNIEYAYVTSGGLTGKVNEYIYGDTTEEVYRNAMDFLQNYPNPMWGSE